MEPLRPVVILLFDLFFFFLLTLDRERVVRQVHFDVVFLHTRELGLYNDIVLFFIQIHCRGRQFHSFSSRPLSANHGLILMPKKSSITRSMSLSQRVRSMKGRHGVIALVSFSFDFSAIVRPSFIMILGHSPVFNSA